MKNIITPITLITLITLLLSCQPGKDIRFESQEDVQSLLDAEQKASDLSAREGFTKAMLASVDDSAVLLRPGYNTAIKSAEIKAFLEKDPDTAVVITWVADKAVVAASGELGYTYGTYTLHIKKDGGIRHGTYATIWRREKKAGWKMLLDTGNPGAEEMAADTASPAPAPTQAQ